MSEVLSYFSYKANRYLKLLIAHSKFSTTNAAEISRREQGVTTCLRTTCHRSNLYVASCSQTGIYTLLLLIDVSSVCCPWVTSVITFSTLLFQRISIGHISEFSLHFSVRYLKLLVCQGNFSGTREFILTYQ